MRDSRRIFPSCVVLRIIFTGIILAGFWVWPTGPEAQPLSEMNTRWLKEQENTVQWGRDPFALPGRRAEGTVISDGEFHLSAIIYRAGRGLAIINNQILRKGDTIDGYRVLVIKKDRVVLRGAQGEQELRVNKFVMGR